MFDLWGRLDEETQYDIIVSLFVWSTAIALILVFAHIDLGVKL